MSGAIPTLWWTMSPGAQRVVRLLRGDPDITSWAHQLCDRGTPRSARLAPN